MELTPKQSANLSSDVYALTKIDTIKEAIAYLNLRYQGKIVFHEDKMLKGRTGGPGFIKVRTAFGFLLVGKGTLQGNVFLLFRGTQYLADWLTNLNISFSKSTCGKPVHDGFNQAFHSMLSQIEPFVNSLPAGTDVHCVGHSLGGALATLAAEWVKKNSTHNPRLYTFGSPRVGLIGFSENCTKLLQDTRIFRAYHRTDVVPCIPIWPFVHTPSTDNDYFLPSTGLIPGAEWHDMDRYIESVGSDDWLQLSALRPQQRSESQVETWLKSKAVIGQTITAIEWLNDALIYVVKKCFEWTGRCISFGASTYFTLMDQIARVLERGVSLADKASNWVLMLVRKIADFLGLRRVIDIADATQAFLHDLLMRLSARVNQITQRALSASLAKGRAV